jgi:PAS domain S-box-containing protein
MRDFEKTKEQLIAELEGTLDAISEGLLVFDPGKLISHMNCVAAQAFGFTQEDMSLPVEIRTAQFSVTNARGEFLPVDDLPGFRSLRGETIRGEQLCVKVLGREPFWALFNSGPIRNASGKVIGSVVTFLDITKNKLLEDSLRESEERFRMIFDSAGDAIFILDQDLRFVSVNKIACERLGYREQELLGLGPRDLDAPEDAALIPERKEKIDQNGELIFESVHLTKDGRRIPVEINARKMVLAGKHYHLSLARDISERKQLEEALQKSNEQLETRVEQRTRELQDMNMALRALLKIRDKDRQDLQDQVLENMRFLILPYVEQVRKVMAHPLAEKYLLALERNLEDMTSSFTRSLRSEYRNLTLREIKVADLVRGGMSSKDIAEMLNISVRTAEHYRKIIREKLGLSGKKANLRSYLTELSRS